MDYIIKIGYIHILLAKKIGDHLFYFTLGSYTLSTKVLDSQCLTLIRLNMYSFFE